MNKNVLLFFLILLGSCKKESTTNPSDDPADAVVACDLKIHTIQEAGRNSVDIVSDTVYVHNNEYFMAELSTAPGEGIALIFKDISFPAGGDYPVTSDYSRILSDNEVFIEYYKNNEIHHALKGKLRVMDIQGLITIKSCELMMDGNQMDDFNLYIYVKLN